ncbi:MAG TPA: GNAT family N-acetyltransferase [Ktedonobacterales bacterium]
MPFRRLWAYEHGTLWTMVLDGAAPVPAAAPSVTFGEVPPEAAESLTTAMGPEQLPELRRRFAAGRRCFVARVAGDIVAYGWVSQGVEHIGELERTLHMRPDEAYIWDCATLPAYRRKGLYTALLGYIAATLQGEGVCRLWIGTSLQNRPSLQGMAAAGFQPVITVLFVRILTLSHLWVSGEATAPPAHVAAAQQALTGARARGRLHDGKAI